MDGSIAVGWGLAGVLVVLVAGGAAVVWGGGLGDWRRVVSAALRAVGQLAAVSLVITGVLKSGWLTGLFVLLMFGIASLTSARRISTVRRGGWAAAAIGCGVAPVLALLLGSGLVPVTPIAVVPIAGILIGGAMTATTLAGRRALDELSARRGEYEAALALGLSTQDSARLVCRPTAGQALVPALDQTRTVGLVTLPGTFVGLLLGGAGPIQAGATQLVVLVALLAIEAVAVVVTVELVAAQRLSRAASLT